METITLIEFIQACKDTLWKTPKVENYNKIKSLLPQLEKMLDNNGDIDIPVNGLIKAIKTPIN